MRTTKKQAPKTNSAPGAPPLSKSETREAEVLYEMFLIEKRAKNKAYAFILSHGLLSEYAVFSSSYRDEADTIDGRIRLALKTK